MEPTHPNPACYSRDGKRIANIFHRDHQGRLVLQVIGLDHEVDRIAAMIASWFSNHGKPDPELAGSVRDCIEVMRGVCEHNRLDRNADRLHGLAELLDAIGQAAGSMERVPFLALVAECSAAIKREIAEMEARDEALSSKFARDTGH